MKQFLKDVSKMNGSEKLYSLREVSKILGVSYNHLVNKIVKGGHLETINVGKGTKPQHRVTQNALNDFLASQSSGKQNTIETAVAELQGIRNSVVISYITRPENLIKPDDALLINDIIEDIRNKKQISGKIPVIDLFINSFGGNLDAAYKIARIVWQYADRVNAIVPINAKSAATAICAGTREILMLPISELGPVDPIIENPVTNEKIPAKSIKIFLSYASDKERLEADKIDPQIIDKLGDKLEPLLAGAYFNAINTSKEYLRILIGEYMFGGSASKPDISKIVESLTEQHSSHAFVIDLAEAQKIGLNVKMADEQESQAIKKLMVFYNQFMNSQGLTKLVGNEYFQMHQNLREG